MTTTKPILLLLGAGNNIGLSTLRKFSTQGYAVASASRNPSEEARKASDLSLKADFANPSSLDDVFSSVEKELGVPSVVIYNAAAFKPAAGLNPLSVPISDFANTLTVNTISAYAAASLATSGFVKLPSDAARAFIYTGNILNHQVMPSIMTLGVGKAATAHVIESAVKANEGVTSGGVSGSAGASPRYYYVDQRTEEGKPVGNAVDGDGHAEEFWTIAESKEQGEWEWTFVKGTGYRKF